jgi:hypothetical protein
MDGELTPCAHDHFNSGPAGVHEAQIPQLGGNNAYPDQPFWFCRLEKDIPEDGGGFPEPELETVSVSMAFDDQPQLSVS